MENGLRAVRLGLVLGAYPAVLCAACLGWWALRSQGIDENLAALLAQAAAFLFIWMLEQVQPHSHRWQRPHGDRCTDALHFVVSMAISVAALRFLRATLAPLLAAQLTRLAHGSSSPWIAAAGQTLHSPIHLSLWPHAWPLPLQLVLGLVVAELGGYVSHRAMHTWNRLWPFHATHHSALRLYFLNASRNHPIDMLISVVATFLPLVFLGMNDTAFALFSVFTSTHLLLQHSNIEQRTGPLNWVFSTAEVHRWHHSRRRHEADANYGQVLLIWDVLFGTRRVPQVFPPPVDVGFDGDAGYPQGYLGQLIEPFCEHERSPLH